MADEGRSGGCAVVCCILGQSTTRKSIESSTRLGRHRWVVERTVSWLTGCRRLHRRYERKAEHFLAFAGIAAALICHRRFARVDGKNVSV
ncbi:hypothetical protein GCM10010378_30450 [Streptomyces viridochromogenes]